MPTREMDEMTSEPECPSCGVGVDRPKCFFDLGGYCPRHPLLAEWHQSRWGKMARRYSIQQTLWRQEDNTKRIRPEKGAPETRAVMFRIYGNSEVYQGA